LLGKKGAKGRTHLIQQDNGNRGNYGFRVGKWKLQRHDSKKARNVELRLVSTAVPQYQLFDLEKDPAEKNNVAADYPQVTERLKAQLTDIIKSGRSRSRSPNVTKATETDSN
jgi:arylsulfatase A